MIEEVRQGTREVQDQVLAVRRHLHAHPELSFQEHDTAAHVAGRLREAGIEVREGVAGTGLIATLEGGKGSGGEVTLRADLDALPIQELNDLPFKSTVPGVMHACGHDAHTAMVLGAGLVLHALLKDWGGIVRLLFQPGEEKLPGGASLMLKEKALGDPPKGVIIGQHITPELATGLVGFHPGPFMASADELYVTVKGKGGHAAMPHRVIDPVLITAHLITGLQQLVSRRAKPGDPTVLSFGKVTAEGATNVIPDQVKLEGTLRAFNEEWREELHTLLPRMAEGIAEAMGGSCEFEVRKGYPVLVNDPDLTGRLRGVAEDYLGSDRVVTIDRRMGAEDFAYYSQVMPACFWRLGTGNAAKGSDHAQHNPHFDVDEDALPIGTGLMALAALREVKG